MKQQFDSTDKYYIEINKKLFTFVPIIGLSAALTFTIARLCGLFSYVSLAGIIGFDFACISYLVLAFILRKKGIIRDGKVSQKAIATADLVLLFIIILQWNLISYIFPTRSFWGYAPMFVLLSSFMFRSESVRNAILGVSASIAISWVIRGDELLPARDELFWENLVLRIVALVVSFTVIYLLTKFAENFANEIKITYRDLEDQNDELTNMGRDVINFTAEIIEERDGSSGLHVKRLKNYTRILAEEIAKKYPEYQLTDDDIVQISQASVLHDVGKVAIPDSILLKPGPLTPEEFDIIKTHTTIGARIIDKLPESVDSNYKRYCREICLFHHEKFDGKGYPMGLKGDDIPISAQIISVVDCYDALTNERSYKLAYPSEVAINMILNGECGVFSKKILKALVDCKEKLLNV